jgi:hypothetical protein
MAQAQDETFTADPATQAFIADRQIFWHRFTRFTLGAVIVVIVLVVAMWLFLT